MTNCELTECILKNINIESNMSIFGLEIMGGEMKQVILAGNQLMGNLLTNIKAEDVNLNGHASASLQSPSCLPGARKS